MMPVTHYPLKPTRGRFVAGDTLFIDGTPHKMCGHCGCLVNSQDGVRTKHGGRDKVTVEVKPYKVTVCLGWIDGEDEIVIENGFPTIKHNRRPMLKQVLACFECWNLQKRRAASTGTAGWFTKDECTTSNITQHL